MKRRGGRPTGQQPKPSQATPELHSERTGRFPKGTPKPRKVGQAEGGNQKSLDAQIHELTQQRQVLHLTSIGFTRAMIAQRLDVDVRTVERIKARALEDYYVDHTKFVQEQVATRFARSDAICRAFMPRAMGGEDRDGNYVNPDPKAAHVVLRSELNLIGLLNHGRPMKVEHTGAEGGPIMTAQVDVMEKARRLRTAFQQRALGESPAEAIDDPHAATGTNH